MTVMIFLLLSPTLLPNAYHLIIIPKFTSVWNIGTGLNDSELKVFHVCHLAAIFLYWYRTP